jgi:hypothetical protein
MVVAAGGSEYILLTTRQYPYNERTKEEQHIKSRDWELIKSK